jgi:hypothetical protein
MAGVKRCLVAIPLQGKSLSEADSVINQMSSRSQIQGGEKSVNKANIQAKHKVS